MDPRLKGVTQADLEEQFRLAKQISEKTSAANDAVVEIRSVRKELEDRLEGLRTPRSSSRDGISPKRSRRSSASSIR